MFLSNNQTKIIYAGLIGSILLFSISITFYGLWKLPFQSAIPWESNQALVTFYCSLFLSFGGIYFLAYILKNVPLASLIFIFLISLISTKLWCLIVVIWVILSSIILGRFFTNKIQLKSTWLDCFLLGIGILGTIIGLLSHFPINYSGAYGLFLALLCFFGRKILVEMLSDVKHWHKNYRFPNLKFNRFLEIFVFTLILLYFIVSLMPEMSYDSLAMHLFVPAKLESRHYWDFDVNKYVWAVMPMLGNWIYSLAYMLGGETSARLINFCFILALSLVLKRITYWASKSPLSSYIVCTIFLSSPLTFGVGGNLLVESIWTTFALAGISLLLESEKSNPEENQPKVLILAGVFIGLAVASKLMAVFAIPLCLIIILINHRMWFRKESVRSMLIGFLFFSLLGCIPYLTAWILTGNPVFPFFNKLFRSPLWSYENFIDDRWNIAVNLNFLYSITFETNKYLESLPGGAGFQWLLFLPLCFFVLVISRHKKGILLAVLSIIFIGLVYKSSVYLRYVFPAYAMLCIVIGISLVEIEKYSKLLFSVSVLTLVAILILNLTFLSSPFFVYRDFPIQSILGSDSRYDYLARNKPIRNIIEITNALNTKQKPVAILSEPFGAQLKADALYTNWYNRKWQQSFNSVKNEEDMNNLLSEYRIEYLIVDSSFNLTKEQISILDDTTDKVAQISQIQLRKVKAKTQFVKELLKAPRLENKDGWQIPLDNLYSQSSQTVIADEKQPTVQRVKIKPDDTYIAQVSSKCLLEPTQGRVQVNWQDEKGEFIKADIKLFDCTSSWSENSMEITAPSNAAYADFYLSSQTNIKMEFNGASFRE